MKQSPSGNTTFVYDATGGLAAEYGPATAPAMSSATCYLTADHLGSTRMVLSSAGCVTSSFAGVRENAVTE